MIRKILSYLRSLFGSAPAVRPVKSAMPTMLELALNELRSFVLTGRKISGRKVAEKLGYFQPRRMENIRLAFRELNKSGIRAIRTKNPKLYVLMAA